MQHRHHLSLGLLALSLALLGPGTCVPQLPPLWLSPDVSLGLPGLTAADEDLVRVPRAGDPELLDLGALPAKADLSGHAVALSGDDLLAFDRTVELPGGVTAGPADVVRFDGAVFSLAFEGAAEGVPPGAGIDALTVGSGGVLLLSFDTAVLLGSLVAEDEDLVRFSGRGFALFFDGSAAGVDPALDLDAAHRRTNGALLLSFDSSGRIGPVVFDDEDVLEHVPVTGTWARVLDASTRDPAWREADLDALVGIP